MPNPFEHPHWEPDDGHKLIAFGMMDDIVEFLKNDNDPKMLEHIPPAVQKAAKLVAHGIEQGHSADCGHCMVGHLVWNAFEVFCERIRPGGWDDEDVNAATLLVKLILKLTKEEPANPCDVTIVRSYFKAGTDLGPIADYNPEPCPN